MPFPQGGKTLFVIAQLDVSTNLERRAVFSRENILLFVLLSPLDEFGTSCCLLTLFERCFRLLQKSGNG